MPRRSKMMRELVHERDVEIALGVLDHLRGLGDLDRRGAMHARLHHRGVEVGHLLQRRGVVARDHLQDLREAVLLVARVDALGRIADVEILLPAHPGAFLEDGHADLLGRAGVDGRFVDHRGAGLQVLADDLRGALERREVGLARVVDRRGHGDDHEVRVADLLGVVGHLEALGRAQLIAAHFAGGVVELLQALDLLGREVEADGAPALAELDGYGQPDIAQAHDRHGRELLGRRGEGGDIGHFRIKDLRVEHCMPP